ncbi:ATP-binding cassette domain-containing protein, partial [Thiolapillus sp.]
MSTLLEVKNLKKHFPIKGGFFRRVVGQLKAVDDVSFSIPKGHTFGLVGESGCGKSTLGRAILRLHEPTAGEVKLGDTNITALGGKELVAHRKDMQIIFQDPYASLSPRRTVMQTLLEPLETHHIGDAASRRKKVLELLDIVGMRPNVLHRYPHEFSGGQRQRIG